MIKCQSKILFFVLMFPFLLISQELHHEMISSQGKSVELDSGIYLFVMETENKIKSKKFTIIK